MLDDKTQIRPRAQKNEPHRGKRGETANLHNRNGAARATGHVKTAGVSVTSVSRQVHPLLSRNLYEASLPSDPYNRAVMCHRKILAKRTEPIKTATGRLRWG